MKQALFVLTASMLALSAAPGLAQDAVTADPAHYKVVLENDQVRVLRVAYGPGEKSVMHSHPATVAVFQTEGKARFTLPDGKTLDVQVKAGEVIWHDEETHLPENTGDKPFEVILVEVKEKAAAPK